MDIRGDDEPQREAEPPAVSIATTLNPQPGIEPAPHDRSLWLLPLCALMLLAGAVGIYYLPTDLDLLLPLCFWLALTTVLLGAVALRTIPRLALPVNNVVRHRPDGKSITWNRFASLSVLLFATVLVSAIGTSGMIGYTLNRQSLYAIFIETERPFVLLVTSSVVIILLLFVWLAQIGPLQKLLQLRFAGLGILVIPVVTYLALNSWLPSLLSPPSDYTGPFASWPAMVQFARHEADRIDKDAILYGVYFYPYTFSHGPYSPQTTLFNVRFSFVRPNRKDINIDFLDTDPIRLEYVESQEESMISSYAYAQQRFADWLVYIKLGPRDVYSLTEKEAIAFAQRNGINAAEFSPSLQTSLIFDGIWSSRFGVPAVWQMNYITETGSESLTLDVDGTTGRVVRRESEPSESTATPTPQRLATPSPTP